MRGGEGVEINSRGAAQWHVGGDAYAVGGSRVMGKEEERKKAWRSQQHVYDKMRKSGYSLLHFQSSSSLDFPDDSCVKSKLTLRDDTLR